MKIAQSDISHQHKHNHKRRTGDLYIQLYLRYTNYDTSLIQYVYKVGISKAYDFIYVIGIYH